MNCARAGAEKWLRRGRTDGRQADRTDLDQDRTDKKRSARPTSELIAPSLEQQRPNSFEDVGGDLFTSAIGVEAHPVA